jgi:N-acetylglucosaminyl-diphospho-decaprenol L-rhamnosyltransferase
MPASVLIVTVTYNSSSVLEDFLASARKATSHPHTIVVVDNASDDVDATRSVVAAHPEARLLELTVNHGYGGAMNAGVESAGDDADYVLIANPDVVFGEGSIDALVAAAESTPRGGSFGPSIYNTDGSLYPSARELPSLRTGIGHALFSRAWPSNPWTAAYRAPATGPNGRRQAGWLSGACLLLPAPVFRDAQGFDTSYFMYFEDVDLGARLGAKGLANVYVPEARVIHTGAHATSKASASMSLAHHRSAYLYLSRRYSAAHLAPLRALLRISLALRGHRLSRKK